MQKEKHILQKIAVVMGIVCYVASAIVFLILIIYNGELSPVANGSIVASVLFFLSTGFVLKSVSKANLPKL